jgi:hypothetical protein
VLVLAVGLLQAAWVAKDLLSSGTILDPRTSLRLSLQLNQGAVAAVFGAILSAGGFYVDRAEQRAAKTAQPPRTGPEARWHRTLLTLSVLLVLGVVVLSVLPTPSRNVSYAPNDFRPLAQPTNVTTYGAYRFSRNFWADRGSVLTSNVQITWTDNKTGAVLFGGAPGNFTAFVASASSPRESPKPVVTFVVPSDAFYVLVVWLGRCPTLTTGACANTTVAVQATMRGEVPTLYLPVQIVGTMAGAVLVAISAARSRALSRVLLP